MPTALSLRVRGPLTKTRTSRLESRPRGAGCVSDIAIFEVLVHHAKSGAEVAIVCDDESITYAELHRRAEGAAFALADRGVGPGDLVGLALPNGIDFFVALFAVYRLDATPMPLSSKLPGPEFAAIVETARPTLVVDASFDLHLPSSGRRKVLPPVKGSQAWKAMCSGGSTGRPKVIVAGRAATRRRDEEAVLRVAW